MADKDKPAPTRRKRSPRGAAPASERSAERKATSAKPRRTGTPRPATGKPAASKAPAAAVPDTPAATPAEPRTLAVIPLHVRWRDLDAFNHVNNSSYLTFLEESRLQWLRTVPGEWFNEHAMPVMAAVELHYRQPITWPCEVDVQLTCERLGNSSLTVGNRIVDRGDPSRVYADGNVVMVWIDPASGASVQLPEAIRNAVS